MKAKFIAAVQAADFKDISALLEAFSTHEAEQVERLSEGALFPIDLNTGKFSPLAIRVSEILKIPPADLFEQNEFEERAFKSAVERLKDMPRVAFILTADGRSIDRICHVMGCSEDTYKDRLALAISQIKTFCSIQSPVKAAKSESDLALFLKTGTAKTEGKLNEEKFLSLWSALQNKRNRMTPAVFATAFSHYERIKNHRPDLPKFQPVSIVEQQIIDECEEGGRVITIREDMTPDLLGKILGTYERLGLKPQQRLSTALRTLFTHKEEYKKAFSVNPYFADYMPREKPAPAPPVPPAPPPEPPEP